MDELKSHDISILTYICRPKIILTELIIFTLQNTFFNTCFIKYRIMDVLQSITQWRMCKT